MSQADTFQDAAQAGGSGLDTLRRTASQIFAVTLVVMGILVSVLASFWSPDWPLIAGASAMSPDRASSAAQESGRMVRT